jgi:hypothetical protein
MIIFLENGRLGNQLFQYSALKKEFPKDRIILIGFDELSELFDLGDSIIIPKKWFGKVTYKWFRNAIFLLRLTRLISGIEEDSSALDFKLQKKYGIFFSYVLIKNSFFQHRKFTSDLPLNLEIRSKYCEQSKLILSNFIKSNVDSEFVFIHIRRGDYVSWPTLEFPAVLAAKWYFSAMEYFRGKLQNAVFLIFTDDKPYVTDLFMGKPGVIVVNSQGASSDFALMSFCDFGILSASSFSWWAANFSRKRINGAKNFEFVAPNYWIGHASGQWFPTQFHTKWLTFL